jgi:hypothetical protein
MSNVSTLGYFQKSEDIHILNCVNLSVSGEFANKAANVTTAVAAAGTLTAAKMLNKYSKVGTGAGGGYAVTLDTGANLSAAIPNATAGYMFDLVLEEVGSQTCTLGGAVGTTLVGAVATIASGKMCCLRFICTGTDTWTVFKWE